MVVRRLCRWARLRSDMLGRALRWLVDQSLDPVRGGKASGAWRADAAWISLPSCWAPPSSTEKMSMYVTTLVGAILRFAGLAAQKGLALTGPLSAGRCSCCLRRSD